MLGKTLCTACLSSELHGNVVRKHADDTCSCLGQHVNKAQERLMCPESELGLHVWARHTYTLIFDGYCYPATTIQHY